MSDARRMVRAGLARRLQTLFAFDPGQPRDERGRWTDSVGSMVRAVKQHGGFTVNPRTGSSPRTGYQVGLNGRTMTPTPTKEEFLAGDRDKLRNQIKGWIKENADIFASNPNMHIGGWLDTNTGLVHLDPSLWVEGRETARRLGKKQDQIAIWDNAQGREISTGGKGSARR